MKTVRSRRVSAPLAALLLFAPSIHAAAQVPGKIMVAPYMVTNETAQGDAGMLVDEQALAADPVGGTGGHPATQWFPGWSSWYSPAGAVIDLGVWYDLTQVSLYDTAGTGNVTFSSGSPLAWKTLFVDPQTSYMSWRNHPVRIRTRMLHVVADSASVIPSELVLYGTPVAPPVGQLAPVAQTLPLMDKFVGVNGFIDDPIGLLAAAGTVREYHSWGWDEGNGGAYPGYPNNQNKFSPSAAGGWDFDLYYANLAGLGVTASPCVQGSVGWMTPGGNDKPTPAGADPTLPASYAAHADHMFQLAARYGSKPVADGLLKLASDQPRLSGQHTLNYFENWNEENKWWEGRSAYFSPYEFAAMCSADYDGDQGRMGTTFGVKNADPTAKFVMGGLAEATVDYLKAMKLWSDFHRGGSLPFDVINVHHYSTDAGGQGGSATTGISPEADGLKTKMAALVDYRNRYMRGKQLWVSEFGYDTNPGSPFRAPAIGAHTAEEVQGQWIVRSYLALAAAGVDSAEVYMLRDVDPASATQFSTSGLTSSKATGWVPKASWYYVSTLKNRLTGLRFESEVPSGNLNVMIYRFTQPGTTNAVYAVWSPTSTGAVVPGYSLALKASETHANLVTLKKGVRDGISTPLTVTSAHTTINVSETPVFVQVTSAAAFPTLYHFDAKLTLTRSMVTNESGLGDAAMLVDEQGQTGDPATGAGGAPTTMWSPGWGAAYPQSATIDLGKSYTLSQIYLRDLNGTGNVTLSSGTPGNWTPLFTDGLTNYQSWNPHVASATTRYLRVTLGSPSAGVSELVVYVK